MSRRIRRRFSTVTPFLPFKYFSKRGAATSLPQKIETWRVLTTFGVHHKIGLEKTKKQNPLWPQKPLHLQNGILTCWDGETMLISYISPPQLDWHDGMTKKHVANFCWKSVTWKSVSSIAYQTNIVRYQSYLCVQSYFKLNISVNIITYCNTIWIIYILLCVIISLHLHARYGTPYQLARWQWYLQPDPEVKIVFHLLRTAWNMLSSTGKSVNEMEKSNQ